MIPCVSRRSLAALGTALVAAVALLSPASALATFPGRNGKIAFVRNGDIWAINADGSGLQQLTTNPAPDMSPAWNADGTQIVFTRFRNGNWDVFRYVVDGASPPVAVTTTDEDEYQPSWAPDGSAIVFTRPVPMVGMFHNLFVIDAGGANERPLGPGGGGTKPDWSPDGTLIVTDVDGDEWSTINLRSASGAQFRKFPGTDPNRLGDMEFSPSWAPSGLEIVYSRLHYATDDYETSIPNPVNELRRTDLTGRTQIVASDSETPFTNWIDPTWSPDGRSLAYSTGYDATTGSQIRVLDATGRNDRGVTRIDSTSTEPAWQPLKQLNPAPSVSSLSPSSVALGSGAITLIVNGSGFVAGSRVRLNGEDRPTTVVSASRLLAEIPASDLDVAGEARVTVSSPPPGGGVSGSRVLTIQGPPAVAPPRSLSAPAVSGGPRVGEILSCSPGTWSNSPTGFAFAWLRQGVRIPGADAATRQVTAADAGQALACRVEATNAGGTSSAVSEEILVASEQPVVTPPAVTPPAVVGGGVVPAPVVPAPVVRRKTGLIGVGAPSAGRVGAPLRLTATFTGTPAGRVVLQRKVRGRFVNATSLRAGSARVALTFTPQRAGLLVLRVRYASGGVMRLSRNIVIRVRPA